jgi:quercetin dioxygenase-like cupin family protein
MAGWATSMAQLSLVFQGTIEFEVSGERYTVAASEVLQIPANAPIQPG